MAFDRTITEDDMDAESLAFVRELRDEPDGHEAEFEDDVSSETLGSRILTTFTG